MCDDDKVHFANILLLPAMDSLGVAKHCGNERADTVVNIQSGLAVWKSIKKPAKAFTLSLCFQHCFYILTTKRYSVSQKRTHTHTHTRTHTNIFTSYKTNALTWKLPNCCSAMRGSSRIPQICSGQSCSRIACIVCMVRR